MMRIRITLFVVLAFVLGGSVSCRRVAKSYPEESRPQEPRRTQRNKTSGKKTSGSNTSGKLAGPFAVSNWSTVELEKFGRILQEYIGTPYQGTSKYQVGIDCSRFTSEVFRRHEGLRLPRVARDQARSGLAVSRSHIQYGDLVFFAIGGKTVSHVGIYVGDNSFIHASSSRGVVIDKLDSSYWRKYYHSARRVVHADLPRSKSKSKK